MIVPVTAMLISENIYRTFLTYLDKDLIPEILIKVIIHLMVENGQDITI